MLLAGPLDSDACAAYVAQVLVPSLRCSLVFLPAYSPDFSPIEQAINKLKTALRRVQARTREALEAAIAAALASNSATDATPWFRHAGYPLKGQPL